jgi:DNA-binding transcriptional ArsR family regulator
MTIHLRGGDVPAGDIAARFRHSWPTTTRHLQVLQAAGLIRSEAQGRIRAYSVDTQRLGVLREWLRWFDKEGA